MNACQKADLSHYKEEHLFANFEYIVRSTLISRIAEETKSEDPSEHEVIPLFVKYLSRIATKDFEYIFTYFFLTD